MGFELVMAAEVIALNSGVSDVPIPAALPLFAAGLGDIGLMARPKKRKAVVAA
jgi:hypothetical protein